MRILIIGGTSFIGPHVVNMLASQGHEVVVFHRSEKENGFPKSVRHLYGDRNQLDLMKEQFKSFAPDVVLDMILSTQEQAEMLVSTFKDITQRIVVISSQDVYRAFGLVREFETGDLEKNPITELSRLRDKLYLYQDSSKASYDWCNNYDKIVVEKTVMESFEGTILRLPAVYGPQDRQHRLFSYLNLKRMVDKRPFIIMDDHFAAWRWTHAYVEDAALAIVLAVTDNCSSGRIYNVGALTTPTMVEFVYAIGKKMNWDGKVVVVPKESLSEDKRFPYNTTQHLVTDSSRIREELGYSERVSWEEGLSRTIEWELSHMPEITNFSDFDYEKEDEILKELGIGEQNPNSSS